ncbi:DNA-3-methyladenine glycosylase I [Porticoccus sp. W117]|uniref:DNA-3-methyladenine glycosylase I n=1 Tax=Porticoccus sp. W117 TaxID=3054777 RepID=UPI002591A931|nr:DNA-3-methyladenine glycosylase I [Porticoccus sp. W117]MDM3872179.1 DNA-3-methyladenine glycosylase I [Porticoccus sp. W117]
MTQFETLYCAAVKKLGGEQQLLDQMPQVLADTELREIADDRYLSMMTRCVFRAGFVWRVINNKWPGFEAAFDGFNPLVIAHYADEKLEQLAKDERIVRNFQKIKTVRDNATFVLELQRQHGGVGNWLADWPGNDVVGLWLELKKRGSRLGGNSGPGFLRNMGKDTFMLTGDVSAALVNHGLIDRFSATSKRDLNRVQEVFNDLQQQSGLPLAHISKVLAFTV